MADSSVLDLGIEQFATTVVENGSIRLIVPKKNVFTTYCRKVQLGFFFFFCPRDRRGVLDPECMEYENIYRELHHDRAGCIQRRLGR